MSRLDNTEDEYIRTNYGIESKFITPEICEAMMKEDDKGKDKATPLQAWTGHENSRRLRLPDFKTVGT